MKLIAFGAILALTSVPALANDVIGAWDFQSIVDPMSDASRGIANTKTGTGITLVVKCDENGDNSLYFSFVSNKYLGSVRSKFRPIKFRLDGSPPESLDAYHDGQSASVINVEPGNNGGEFLKRLSQTEELTVQLTSYDGDMYTNVIDVTKAREAILKVAEVCKDNSMATYISS